MIFTDAVMIGKNIYRSIWTWSTTIANLWLTAVNRDQHG